jgi:hypothetical protein
VTDLRPRRLVLSADALELLRRRVLPPPLSLPPGFGLAGPPAASPAATLPAELELPDGRVHPSVAGDLELLARPQLAVLVRAALPGLEVTACVAVAGVRGACLLRTGDTAVQLSCFAAGELAGELTRVVPAGPAPRRERPPEEVPLAELLDGSAPSLRGRVAGTLHATVVGAGRVLGSVEWVWDGAGWIGLEPLPSRGGRPWARLVPVGPEDLPRWTAPYVAAAAA